MPRSNEDETWQAIVENYGDRVELDPADEPQAVAPPDPFAVPEQPARASLDDDVEERFVPPPPPPLPHVSRDRMLAWIGLFGSPVILLTSLVVGIHLPSLIGYLLVAGFVGGFLYLVVNMPSGPHDPFDDGARL